MNKIIGIIWKSDRFIVFLLNFFRIGIMSTKDDYKSKKTILIGIRKIEFRFDIVLLKNVKIRIRKENYGKA